MEYLTNTEVLIIEGQKAIANKLGITPQKFEESENMLMERGLAQNLLIIQSSLRSKVKYNSNYVDNQWLPKKKQLYNKQRRFLTSK